MSVVPSSRNTVGFSLIELLVVIGISTMLTGLLLLNMRTYTDYAELKGEAYKIAGLAREAQSHAIATKTYGTTLSYQSVGIHIASIPNTTIIFFGEPNPNGKYDAGDVAIASKQLDLLPGYQIIRVCGSNGTDCNTPPTNTATKMSIAYRRPFVSADVFATVGGTDTAYAYVDITIRSPKQNTRHVQLWKTGQVTIQ